MSKQPQPAAPEMPAVSRREVELELTLWRERMVAVQSQSQALQIQAQLLQHQARECRGEIARLEAVHREMQPAATTEMLEQPAPEPPEACASPIEANRA